MKRLHSLKLFILNLSISGLLVCLIRIIFKYHPVLYTTIIAVDQWGEYLTFAAWLFTAVLMFSYSLKCPKGVRRLLLTGFALLSLFIAGEEISWGQRLLHIQTPAAVQGINLQSEFSFHNLAVFDPLNSLTHRIISIILIMISLYSSLIPDSIKKRLPGGREFSVPFHLIPYFLLMPYFFLTFNVAKADEISELFFGIAILIWTLDYLKNHQFLKKRTVFAIALGVACMTTALTATARAPLTYRLNLMASRDYPYFHLTEQAEFLFQYMDDHPCYLMPDTRMNHVHYLLDIGEGEKAKGILTLAVAEMKNDQVQRNSGYYRRLATAFRLLGISDSSRSCFIKALETDLNRLSALSDQNEKAELFLSLSKTYCLMDDSDSALQTAEQAAQLATVPVMSNKIRNWMSGLQKSNAVESSVN